MEAFELGGDCLMLPRPTERGVSWVAVATSPSWSTESNLNVAPTQAATICSCLENFRRQQGLGVAKRGHASDMHRLG